MTLGRHLKARPLEPARIPAKFAAQLIASLESINPGVEAWIYRVTNVFDPVDGSPGHRLREERDATSTGIALANIELSESLFDSGEGLASNSLNPSLFADNEDDLLFHDLRHFDEGGVLTEESASTSVYSKGDFSLLIANVNRKPLEHTLGVDLLYWDRVRNSYTLLQYKRLHKAGSGESRRWVYTKRSDIEAQLKKMRSLPPRKPAVANDWRFLGSPFWFKFVKEDAFDPEDQSALRGLYLPADYIEFGLTVNQFLGPQGGFELGYNNASSLSRGPFIEMVRRGFSGSTAASSADILAIISSLSPERELVVVAKGRALKG